MLGDSLSELALTDNGRGENGIGSCDTSGDNKAIEPIELRDELPDEDAHDEPSESHDGNKEVYDRLPVFFHIVFGKFYTDGETLDDQDNSGEFDGDDVEGTPFLGVDEVGSMGTKDDTAESGHGSFTNVHALLDEG
jgi:hypothetical protein